MLRALPVMVGLDGDLGSLDSEGNLYFKERAKDLFKTANAGKYIAPNVIENMLISWIVWWSWCSR